MRTRSLRERWHQARERFWALAGAVPVQVKMMGILLAMVLIFGLSAIVLMRAIFTETLTQKMQEQGRELARHLASQSADLILTHNLFALHELLRQVIDHNRDVRYVFVVDQYGQVIASSFGQHFPTSLLGANQVTAGDTVHLEILQSEEGLLWDFAAPVVGGQIGTVRVGITERYLQETVWRVTLGVLGITLFVSLLGIVGAYALTRVITRPLGEMVQATRAVARGDLTVRAPVWARDEIGALGEAFNRMVAELAQAQHAVQQTERARSELLRKLLNAQEDERRRIARELHDQLGQQLTYLLLGLTVLENLPAHETRAHLDDLKKQTGQTLDNVRALARELRPAPLDELGLVVALERYVQDYARRFPLKVDFQSVNLDGQRLPAQTEIALYRIVQEAMTNVVRHAQARSVSILIERRGASIVAIVEDDGKGLDMNALAQRPERSLGLLGMHERVALLGGRLTIESAPGEGTTVFVEIPMPEG